MRLACIVVVAAAAFVIGAFAGRPLVVSDAEPVEHKKFQLETGALYLRNGSTEHFDGPIVLTYGLTTRAEIAVGARVAGNAPDFTATIGFTWVF
jgi:hypothetical protein